jgi:BlaI family transcriptional regulator, penicillinase repressor
MRTRNAMSGQVPEPTKSELEILQALWEKGPSTVRTVNEALNEQRRDVNYSSTLKLMQIMLDKGLLEREVNGHVHTYKPAHPREQMQAQVIRNVVNLAFGGSASALVLQALGSGDTTPETLAEIKEMIRRIEEQAADSGK